MIDRTGWYSGPWDSEPDRLLWAHRGMPCLIRRMANGALAGFVGVTEDHPLYGASDVRFEVHGGITFAGALDEEVEGAGALWWFGFDCAHGRDSFPGEKRYHFGGDVYRTMAFVRGQCEFLARQVSAKAEGRAA